MTPEELEALKANAAASKARVKSAADKIRADSAAKSARITQLEAQVAAGDPAAVAALKALAEELIDNNFQIANELDPPAPPAE